MEIRSSINHKEFAPPPLFQIPEDVGQPEATSKPNQEGRIRLRVSGTNRVISIPRLFNSNHTPEKS